MEIRRATRLFSLVSSDLTNHGNPPGPLYRANEGSPCEMSMTVYQKLLQLLPYTQEGGFTLSTRYEPTKNPHFIHMVTQVPRQYKANISLSSSLNSPLSDKDLPLLAESNLHHISVCLPSYDPALYAQLTAAQSIPFLDNLTRLRTVFDQHSNRPHLQLTTPILRSNYAEIPALVQRAHEELRPHRHDLHTPAGRGGRALTAQEAPPKKEELLSRKELTALEEQLAALGYKNLHVTMDTDQDNYALQQEAPPPQNVWDAYALYIGADGQGLFLKDENPFDLADIDHPFVFFSKALLARQAHQAATLEIREPLVIQDKTEDPEFHTFVDHLTIWDERFIQICGWGFHRQVENSPLYLVLETRGETKIYQALPAFRPDVAQEFGDPTRTSAGFDGLIDPRSLPFERGQVYNVSLGVRQGETLYTKLLADLSF